MLRVLAASEKGHQDRLLPLAPEIGEMLLAVPEEKRSGYVFNPLMRSGARPTPETAGRMISTIGEKAVVKVDESNRKGTVKPKWASAHDCRRAFGLRWAMRLQKPLVLQQLMRHADISTTLKYYVGSDAEGMADVLYASVPKSPEGNFGGNSATSDDHAESTQPIAT